MFLVNGIPHYTTAYLDKLGLLIAFKSAVAVYGWRHESQGVWRGDLAGKDGLTISKWLAQRQLVRTAKLVESTGFSRQWIGMKAKELGLKPVAKGRWSLESAASLLKALGCLSRCPKCGGVAANRDGEVTCLECKIE